MLVIECVDFGVCFVCDVWLEFLVCVCVFVCCLRECVLCVCVECVRGVFFVSF